MPPHLTSDQTARRPDEPRPEGTVRIVTGRFGEDAPLHDPSGRSGAVVRFTGVVRGDALDESGPVTHLEFECYPEMAEAELERIRGEGIARFGLTGLSLHHRTGRLQVGDEIVRVEAAAAHRREAFEAAAWAMDEIKRRVPLWKREVGARGASRWVPGDDCSCGHPR